MTKIQLMSNAKEWKVVDGVEVLVDVPQVDLDPITDSLAVNVEGGRTLEEQVSMNNAFSLDIDTTKVVDSIGGEYSDNVMSGAYEKATLYGNTQVNLVEEDTGMDTIYIPQSFTSFDARYTTIVGKQDKVVAPLLKGRTLINLSTVRSYEIESEQALRIYNIEPNCTYTVKFKFTTKNTQSGVVIQSYTGSGTFLDNTYSIVGLGDNASFKFVTHEQAGMIHICNSLSYGGEAIKLDDIVVVKGDWVNYDLDYFKGMKSVELVKGLTNIFTNDLTFGANASTVTNNDGTVVVTATSSGIWRSGTFSLPLKQNTSYVVMWDSITATHTALSHDNDICFCNEDNIVVANSVTNPFTNKRSILYNTGESSLRIRIHATTKNSESGTTTVKGLRVFEFDESLYRLDLQTIGYFSGTKYVGIPTFRTRTKNLYPYGDINFTPTQVQWHDAKGANNMYEDVAKKSTCRFLLDKGTYTLRSDYFASTNIEYMTLVTDDGLPINATNNSFVLDKPTYLTLRLRPLEANVPTTLKNIQIERGDTETNFVVHEDRCLYPPTSTQEIVLRSLPNGVCDTFNIQTGEYTQRVWSQVISGSISLNNNFTTDTHETYVINPEKTLKGDSIYCDKFLQGSPYTTDSIECITINSTGTQIAFRIDVSKLEGATATEYLSNHPITIQYELKEPIVTKLPVSSNLKRIYDSSVTSLNMEGAVHTHLKVCSSPSTLEVGSLTSINPIVEPITTLEYNARLKPNTTYTVFCNNLGRATNINLGGGIVTLKEKQRKCIIKTAINESEGYKNKITFSGDNGVNRVIVLEGDKQGMQLPYFKSMCNVKMPILTNINKNLFDPTRHKSITIRENKFVLNSSKWWNYEVEYNVKPNTKYTLTLSSDCKNCWVCIIVDREKYSTQVVNKHYQSIITDGTGKLKLGLYANTESNIGVYLNSIQLEEGTSSNYQPHEANKIYLTQGEIPLIEDMFELGTMNTDAEIGATHTSLKVGSAIRIRSKEPISVKPNTKYQSLAKSGYDCWFLAFGIDKGYLNKTYHSYDTFTTDNDTYYVVPVLRNVYNTNVSTSIVSNFQLLEINDTVQMRSLPNGVKDEINLLTGEYIQRIKEIVLDGSEDEEWKNSLLTSEDGNYSISYVSLKDAKKYNTVSNISLLCDNFISIEPTADDPARRENREFVALYRGTTVVDGIANWLYLSIKNTKLATQNTSGLRAYLKSNPITVQYELAEPIVKQIRIVSDSQEREIGVKLPNGASDTYNMSTGITTQRVGVIVYDGSDDEGWVIGGRTNDTYFEGWNNQSPLPNFKLCNDGSLSGEFFTKNIICDRHIPFTNETLQLGISVKNNVIDKGAICMVIKQTDLAEKSISAFKSYLQENPVTIYYELATPIIKTDIILPSGVKDEYVPVTGKYTQYIGKIVLDNSEDEIWVVDTSSTKPADLFRIAMRMQDMKKTPYNIGNFVCSGISYCVNNDRLTETTRKTPNIWDYYENSIYLDFKYSDLNATSDNTSEEILNMFKAYLQSNPITVWYELATPRTIQLTPHFAVPTPYGFKGGYLIMDTAYEGESLPPQIVYSLPTNRSGQLSSNQQRLKKHTDGLTNLQMLLTETTINNIFEIALQEFELELMDIQLLDLEGLYSSSFEEDRKMLAELFKKQIQHKLSKGMSIESDLDKISFLYFRGQLTDQEYDEILALVPQQEPVIIEQEIVEETPVEEEEVMVEMESEEGEEELEPQPKEEPELIIGAQENELIDEDMMVEGQIEE